MNDTDLTREQLLAELESARVRASCCAVELERARQLADATLESIPDGFMLLDPSGRVVTLNNQAERFLPSPRPGSELQGRNFWELYPDLIGTQAEREFRAAVLGQHEVAFEQFYPPAGKWFEVRACPAAEGLGIYYRDVTERKRAEETARHADLIFRRVWENSADGMRLTDAEGRIVLVNAAFCRLVERGRGDLEGELLNVAYAPVERERVLAGYRERFAERRINSGFETEMLLWSQRRVWFEVTNAYLEAPERPPILLSIFRDITDRKRTAEQRLALERKLLEAQKLESLGVLAGGIAHDFNNLLVSVLGNAGLALMELPPDDPTREALERIENAAQRAAELTKQMLAVSGKGRFVTRRLDLSTVIDEMTHLLGVALSRDVTLRFQTTKGLPVVEADPVQIRQVVMNLVLNAAEALGTQPGEVTLATGLIDANREFLGQTLLGPDLSPGPYITLEVSDTGCGMDAATLPKIFDPFFTTKFPGRGLGLAAVLGIVRGHHGTLRVQSAVGKGTTFTILLPAAEARSPSGAGSPGTSSAEQLGGGTILLIDDEAEVRHVTQKMLERMGFTVLSADGGAAGLELFRQHGEQITCTLLDLTMPHLSGEEVFSLIRSLQAEARIVLMSGYSSADAGPRLASRGLAGFVEKPFTHVQLQERLRQALGRL